MAENKRYDSLFSRASKQMNCSEEELRKAAEKGDISSILKNADSQTAAKAEQILNDPQKTREILESPQAKAILEMLRKGK